MLDIKKEELLCFVVFVFLASLGLWFRQTLFGFDSYAGLNAICYGFTSPFGTNPVWVFFLGLLPCNVLLLKLVMFVSLVVGLLAVWCLVAKFFGKRLAWISTFLLVSLSPVVLFSFLEFENEVIAYPLLLWAIYFIFEKEWDKVIVLGWFGFLFWAWVYYLTFIQTSFSKVTEMNLFHGILDLWLLLPFVVGISLLWKKNKFLCLFGLLGVGVWLWNSKLWILLLPALCLSIANIVFLLEKKLISLKYLYLLAVFCLIGWNVTYWLQSPNQNDWFLVETAIKESNDQNIPLYSDLGWDYWTVYKTGKETFVYQQLWEDLNVKRPFIWLTSQDNNSCVTLYERIELASCKKVMRCD